MDAQRFDVLTRRFGAGSRRRVLSALIVASLGRALPGLDTDEAAAACKGFNAKCGRDGDCCAADGLRCVKIGKGGKGKKRRKRCQCKSGTCPSPTPCCVRGKCEELCDGECCADCFVELSGTGQPIPSTILCCPPDNVCGPNPKSLSDDRCCFDSEECVAGVCCTNNGALGSVVCGGTCCPQDACCNGVCCPQGQVCADTPAGDQCVSANRICNTEPNCFANENCLGGTCCAENRQCTNAMGNDFCCPAGQYCELPGGQTPCCPINTTCNSFKGHRVRR
jgi:hypothetical protein